MRPNPYRDCLKCGQPVHARTPACKACGAVSPWAKAPDRLDPDAETVRGTGPSLLETTSDAPMTMETLEAAKEMLRNQPDATQAQATVHPKLELVTAPVDLDPSPEAVAAYIHDITAPARAAEAARELIHSGPHVFMDKFSTMIGSSLAHFKVNDVVTDFPLLQELKAQDAPMVPVGNAPGMACCPACKTVFKVPKPVPAKRVG